MLTIAAMHNDLRLAGSHGARERMARRIERLLDETMPGQLEQIAGAHADEEGPIWLIRRLDLRLWLLPGTMQDGDMARLWAAALARALARQIAEGGPAEVLRYADRGAFLAAWASDLVDGRADGRWQYREFAILEGSPSGHALAHGLGRHPRWIARTFAELGRQGATEAVVARFGARDVAALWRIWTGAEPRAARKIDTALVARIHAAGIDPPAAESGGADARARAAFRWLIILATAPGALPAEALAPLAMQLAHLSALVTELSGLRLLLGARQRSARAIAMLAAAPADLATAAGWLQHLLGTDAGDVPELLALLVGRAQPVMPAAARPAPKKSVSAFAGTALLLPACRALQVYDRLGPAGLNRLLAAAIRPPQRLLAGMDRPLRLLSGLPEDVDPERLPAQRAWPSAEELGIDPGRLARDAATHGDIPELPSLRAVLDRFVTGLRGMEGSSADYLARQFLHQSGTLLVEPDRLTIRLHRLPLRVLLGMAGRLGDLGRFEWLGQRALVIEAADG
jgi:hypothetical protein